MRGVDDHATKELPLERVDPHVRVAERRRIDKAADDDPDAAHRSGLAGGTDRLRDGLPAEALHARDEPRELRAFGARRTAAVVIWLSGFGNVGIADIDAMSLVKRRRGCRSTEHDDARPT